MTDISPQIYPDDITVLIPAAGKVPEGLLALSNIVCTAQIPVAGRPVIYWTLKYLKSLGIRRFNVAVPRRGLFVEDFVECTAGANSQHTFVVPPGGSEGGLGQTVAALLETVTTRAALVVLGDTSFTFVDPGLLWKNEPAVLVGAVEESYRWCLAETDVGGALSRLRDKVPDLSGPLSALIGVYYFPDAAAALKAAREVVASAASGGAEPRHRRVEIKAILERVHEQTPIRVHNAGEWLDCGNPDRQSAAHIALLQKREFNDLSIDRTLSTITKRSRMKRKFIDEINYVRLLPPDLAVLFPRLIGYSVDWADPWVTMEYYGYSTLADAWVYENVDPGIWERVFGHLRAIISREFMRYRQPLPVDVMVDMYLTKTRRRLDELAGPPELNLIAQATGVVRINGKPCPSLAMAWDRVSRDVHALASDADGCVIHGDLCFFQRPLRLPLATVQAGGPAGQLRRHRHHGRSPLRRGQAVSFGAWAV